MASAEQKQAIKDLAKRRATAEELLGLHLDNAKLFSNIDTLEAELKKLATEGGDSFREGFDKGYVNASPAKDKQYKGQLPVIDPDKFLALPKAKRQKYLDDGIITLVPTWSRADHGRVTVKVF